MENKDAKLEEDSQSKEDSHLDKDAQLKKFKDAITEFNIERHGLITLLENIPGMVYSADHNWNVNIMNTAVEKISGYSKLDFDNGRVNWSELVHQGSFLIPDLVFVIHRFVFQ